MRQELYFDGILMDIDESTKITLVIKSNIFTEISKCVGNRTYSVQLPKTARNQRVLEFAHLPAANTNSNIPYRYLQCRYVRNGIEIFSDGYAYIVSAKEKIEVCIVWGTPAVLRAIFSDGLKLNEIPDDGKKAPYVRYNEVTRWADLPSAIWDDGYCYAAIDFLKYEGIRNDDIYETPEAEARMPKMGYLRPCIFLNYILERLYSLYGISFDLDAEYYGLRTDLIFPCITKNANVLQSKIEFTANGQTWIVSTWNPVVYKGDGSGVWFRPSATAYIDVSTTIEYEFKYRWNTNEDTLRRVLSTNGICAEITASSIVKNIPSVITIYDSNGHVWNPDSGTNITDNWDIRIAGRELNVFASANELTRVIFYTDYSYGSWVIPYDGFTRFIPTAKSVKYGIDYSLSLNLPDMKIVDFLKWVAAITGTFPRQTDKGDKVLEFVHYHRLFDNTQIALDWSNKLVRAFDDDSPREIDYTVDGWAQVNNFAYKKDEEKGTFADGQIMIDNVQLDVEQNVVGEEFMSVKPLNNIPIYKVNSDDNATRLLHYLFPESDETTEPLEDENTDPCVLNTRWITVNNVDYVQGVFDDTLYWSNILQSDRYAGLIRSLQKAKILHEVFALTELDIKQFDETVPVYLAQYGHYYAVTEIKTSETGVAEVTLFQLEL